MFALVVGDDVLAYNESSAMFWHNSFQEKLFISLGSHNRVGIKGKVNPLQAWKGLEGSQISRQSAHEGGKVVSPTHRPPLPSGNIPGTYFCYRLSNPGP